MAYSNWDVAHRFATGIGDHCRGSNMFFEGDAIYSYGYHFKMAQKWNGKMLYNLDTYSNSTAKHQSEVRAACRGWDMVYCAELTQLTPGTQHFYDKNFEIWQRQIDYILSNQLGRARKPEKYLSEILMIVGRVEAFCKCFGIKVPKEFSKYNKQIDREKVLEFAQKEAKKAEAKKKKAESEAAKKFMNFESDYFGGNYQIVRLRKDKNRFETSLRVQIPFEIGKEFYEKLVNGTLAVGDKVLYYTVRSIGSDIKIGCHTFKRAWLKEFGKKVFATA